METATEVEGAVPTGTAPSFVCKKCKLVKGLDERSKSGHGNECKSCAAAYQREWREANREKVRASYRAHRKRQYVEKKYGLSREEYERRRDEAMTTGCAICHQLPENGKSLHLDHCHATGSLRGWLCENCNRGLGMFGDSVERLLAAAAYLQEVTGRWSCRLGV